MLNCYKLKIEGPSLQKKKFEGPKWRWFGGLEIGMGSHRGLATPSPDMGGGKSNFFYFFSSLGPCRNSSWANQAFSWPWLLSSFDGKRYINYQDRFFAFSYVGSIRKN